MTEIIHPQQFKIGYRILMLTRRAKEGGKKNKPDRVAKKVISFNEEEFNEKYRELLSIMEEGERIYSTIDERDIEKGIMLFKHRQLDADYFDTESHYSFYTDIWNRWISALQSPPSRKSTLFLIDIDNSIEGQNYNLEKEIRDEIVSKKIEIVHQYGTKNGLHIITEPFNPALVRFEIQKNAMMLLAY